MERDKRGEGEGAPVRQRGPAWRALGGREAQTIQMERGVNDDEAMGTEGTALKGTTREGVRAGS